MGTYADWRAQVVAAYRGADPEPPALYALVKDYARAVMVRDVESDLALARSYENSFARGKVKLAGARITANEATTIAAVEALMPVDEDTEAMAAVLENAITNGRAEVNDMADKFDALLLEAAIDLQRHVPFYQVRQLTSYLHDSDGVTNEGFMSRVALDGETRIQQVWYGHYYPLLVAGTYEAEDIVVSNGRLYEVQTGGTITDEQIGSGLTSTDGEDETLGDLVFTYYGGEKTWPVRKLDWYSRNQMLAGNTLPGPCYTVPPQRDQIWFYPVLDEEHRFDLEWVGVATDFEDSDAVTFDRTAAEAAAHYIRGKLAQSELDDAKAASIEFALYQRAVRKAVVDCEHRDNGSGDSVATYDWRRRRHCGGHCCGIVVENSDNASAEPMNTNSEHDLEVATAAVEQVTPMSSNHIEQVTVTGDGGLGNAVLVLSTNRQTQAGGMIRSTNGDRLTLMVTFENAGQTLELRNGTQGGTEIGTFQSYEAGQVQTFNFFYESGLGLWRYINP